MVSQISRHPSLLSLIMKVHVKRAEHLSKFDKQETAEGVDLLSVFQVAELHVLVTVKLSDSFVEVVLVKAALRHPDKKLTHEAAYS